MRQHSGSWKITLLAILLVAIFSFPATAQLPFEVESTDVRVYRDGLAHVTQTLLVDELSAEVTIPLLSASVENLVVLDDNLTAVDYQLNQKNLVIYSLGAAKLQVQYDTNALTCKENEVWTLTMNNPCSVSVVFPVNSTIIYLSNAPTEIDTTNNQVSLRLNSGQWEISYLLQLVTEDQNSQTPVPHGIFSFPFEYIGAITGIVLATLLLVVVLAFKRKRRFNLKKTFNENPQLMKEDREVLQFLAEKGGAAFEAEIRERFPDVPRTSLWRLVKRLEKLEIVEVKKIGLENQVVLKK
ncbi:MAG: hypothetical protein NWE95_13045 [Candidatus Bathyarchaeota archaeon]|nr:hypothetical protein [Candidatus Bathyarchaeota archaeon]